MSKLKTLNHLQDELDKDFAWRLSEIAKLKLLLKRDDPLPKTVTARALVCLLYAHWEGFVKKAAEDYVTFVSNQRHNLEALQSCFVVIGAKKHVVNIADSRKAHVNIEAVDFFRSQLTKRANLMLSTAIDTESNLRSYVLENIALSVGLDPSAFSTRQNQIDVDLVDRRNTIAHGNYLDLSPTECTTLTNDILELIRLFKRLVENAASNKHYLLDPAAS